MIIKNLRTGEILDLTDLELKDFIIKLTRSTFEDRGVKPENTGLRPTNFRDFFISDNYKTFTGVFLITALARINKDKNTRYIIFTEYEYLDIADYIKGNIPIFYIKHEDDKYSEVSWLSRWFRENMGNGFSFVDIDYLLVNQNKSLLIEEKIIFNGELGYGQKLSYIELIKDVLKKAYWIVIKPNPENNGKYVLFYYDMKLNQFIKLPNEYTKDKLNIFSSYNIFC